MSKCSCLIGKRILLWHDCKAEDPRALVVERRSLGDLSIVYNSCPPQRHILPAPLEPPKLSRGKIQTRCHNQVLAALRITDVGFVLTYITPSLYYPSLSDSLWASNPISSSAPTQEFNPNKHYHNLQSLPVVCQGCSIYMHQLFFLFFSRGWLYFR